MSLSGGADSSAVSCLVALMVELAAADLGADGLRRALAYIPYVDGLLGRPAVTADAVGRIANASSNDAESVGCDC